MKTKHSNFRKLKCSSKFYKIHAVLQNAARILISAIYIQTSTVQINVYIAFILPVSIYMCTICLLELTVALQNSKPASCKMLAFLKKKKKERFRIANHWFCMNQLPSLTYTKTQSYNFLIVGLHFLQDTEIEKPGYEWSQKTSSSKYNQVIYTLFPSC